MATVSIQEAQAGLPDLIHGLGPGEEVVITENNLPVARLIPAGQPSERKLGTLKGTVLSVSPDFDAPLDDFKEIIAPPAG
jgi:antitoxin (DNA-binding transcriptional repressor) of toxin-antitoxin stability system